MRGARASYHLRFFEISTYNCSKLRDLRTVWLAGRCNCWWIPASIRGRRPPFFEQFIVVAADLGQIEPGSVVHLWQATLPGSPSAWRQPPPDRAGAGSDL